MRLLWFRDTHAESVLTFGAIAFYGVWPRPEDHSGVIEIGTPSRRNQASEAGPAVSIDRVKAEPFHSAVDDAILFVNTSGSKKSGPVKSPKR